MPVSKKQTAEAAKMHSTIMQQSPDTRNKQKIDAGLSKALNNDIPAAPKPVPGRVPQYKKGIKKEMKNGVPSFSQSIKRTN